MIEAVLLLFFAMSNAQQQYVADAACTVDHEVVNTYMTPDNGVAVVYEDGSYITYSTYGIDSEVKVYNTKGTINY